MCVAICDHHAIIRDGVREVLHRWLEEDDVVEISSYSDALEAIKKTAFSLVILEVAMPGWQPLDGLDAIRRDTSGRVAVLSGIEDPAFITAALSRGIAGYIPKRLGLGAIASALGLVLAGEIFVPSLLLARGDGAPAPVFPGSLTVRERQVLSLVRDGHSNKVIARQLNLSEVTVKTHLSSTFRKLGVSNRVQAVRQVM